MPGTKLTRGLYVPAPGEDGTSWATQVGLGFSDHDAWHATHDGGNVTVSQQTPTVYVDKLSGAASDTDANRGTQWMPYLSLDQVRKELTGASTPGPLITVGKPLRIVVKPGPPVQLNFADVPYTAGKSDWGGQAHQLTAHWDLPKFVRLELPQATVSGGTTGPTYSAIVFGSLAGVSLVQIGSSTVDGWGAGIQGGLFINTNGTGDGVALGTQGQHSRFIDVHVFACGRDGFVATRHSNDGALFSGCMSFSAQRNNFMVGAPDNSADTPNGLRLFNCRFAKGVGRDFAWYANATNDDGDGALVQGTWGGNVLLRGTRGLTWSDSYTERSFFELDSHDGTAGGFPTTGCRIVGGVFKSDDPTATGAAWCRVRNAQNCSIVPGSLVSLGQSAAKPLVKMETNAKFNYADVVSVWNGVRVRQTSGTAYPSASNEYIQNAGTGNWGHYYDSNTTTIKRWGTWPV